MDSYYQYGVHSNGDKIVQNAGRVYINPNFQRNSTLPPQNTSMYLNPQFHTNTQHHNLPSKINKPKIYVNPNFVRANTSVPPVSNCYTTPKVASTMNSYCGIPSASVGRARTSTPMVGSNYSSANRATLHTSYVNNRTATVTSTDSLHLPNVPPTINRSTLHTSYVNSRNTTVTTNSLRLPITPTINPQNTQAVAVAKSRYSLIRQNKNANARVEDKIVTNTDKIVTKMKISKYKTISLDHVKKMQNQKDKPMPKALPKTNMQVVAEKTRRISRDFTKSRFKLIKNNLSTKAIKMELKTPIKRSLSSSKIMLGSSQKVRIRVDMTKFKKNNIPCPLFKKYGTCLRNSKGKCQYLHDKKHVSICRKFLKGVCHDNNCLLSHEITAEKMPTCSFYLKGMCTREDCPYLHVKLNEKTKICLDFLKGYCEKGNKCLNRHVNICPDQAMKGSCIRKKCPYPHRPNKKNISVKKVNTKKLNQSIKSIINKKIDKKENITGNSSNQCMDKVEENKDKDCRYYKEVVEDKSREEVEMIKPTRCKLGALPSFIQL